MRMSLISLPACGCTCGDARLWSRTHEGKLEEISSLYLSLSCSESSACECLWRNKESILACAAKGYTGVWRDYIAVLTTTTV